MRGGCGGDGHWVEVTVWQHPNSASDKLQVVGLQVKSLWVSKYVVRLYTPATLTNAFDVWRSEPLQAAPEL